MSVFDHLGVDVAATLADAANRAKARGDGAAELACEDAALRLSLRTQTPGGASRGELVAPPGHHRKPEYRTDPR